MLVVTGAMGSRQAHDCGRQVRITNHRSLDRGLVIVEAGLGQLLTERRILCEWDRVRTPGFRAPEAAERSIHILAANDHHAPRHSCESLYTSSIFLAEGRHIQNDFGIEAL